MHRWKESTLLVDSEGHLEDVAAANKASAQVWEALELAMNHSAENSEKIQASTSLYDFFLDWCDKASNRGEITEDEKELILGMSTMWGAYVGDRVERQSLKFFFLEDCIEGGEHNYWLLHVIY